MIDDVKKTAEQKMGKSIDALKHDFAKVRTGRAHTGLLDHIHEEIEMRHEVDAFNQQAGPEIDTDQVQEQIVVRV